MSLAPQRKVAEIAERMELLEAAAKRSEPLNEVAWYGIRNELLRLEKMPREYADACVLLACIEQYRGAAGVEGFRYYAAKAFACPLQSDRLIYLWNGATNLMLVDVMQQARDLLHKAGSEVDPINLGAGLNRIGRFIEAGEVFKRNQELFSEHSSRDNIIDLIEMTDYFVHAGLKDDETSARTITAMTAFIEASGASVRDAIGQLTHQGVIVGIGCNASDEQRAELDWIMAEAVADSFDDTYCDHLSFAAYPSDLRLVISEMAGLMN